MNIQNHFKKKEWCTGQNGWYNLINGFSIAEEKHVSLRMKRNKKQKKEERVQEAKVDSALTGSTAVSSLNQELYLLARRGSIES